MIILRDILFLNITVYTIIVLICLIKVRLQPRQFKRMEVDISYFSSISVIKPIKGISYSMYENFVSFCRQDYPGGYEIILVTASKLDPALEVVKKLGLFILS